MPNPKRKGGANERRIATKLSLWFSGGERDDIFWRTDSGSRGTTRGRKGKKTANAQGDIVALDAVGIPLLDVWCIECKKGYSDKLDLLAMIDSRARHHEIITFWEQTLESARAATAAPLVIIQRDRRKDVAVISQYMFDEMYDWLTATPPTPFNFIRVKYDTYDLIVMELENFLTLWPPSVYNTIYQEKQRLQENESKNQETGVSARPDTERRPGRHAQGKSNRPSPKTSKRRVAEAD